MWRLVPALTLVSVCSIAAFPRAQQNLDDLFVETFSEAKTTIQTPVSVPQIGGDLNSPIEEYYKNGGFTTTTPTSSELVLESKNQPTPKPDDCECVPYYECEESRIDLRSDFDSIDDHSQGASGRCENFLDACCKPPDRQQTITPTPTSSVGCGQRYPEGVGFRVTGQTDNEAQFGEFPWMVAILKEETIGADGQKLNVHQCEGALIHIRAVLTAAHCVNKKQPQELKIRAGEWDTMTNNEIFPHQDRNVERIVVHENFHSGAFYNDYAILILTEPVEYAANVDVICLPDTNMIFDGSRCFATGWRNDVFDAKGHEVILNKIELPVVPHDSCQNTMHTTRLGKNYVLDQSFICAGGETGKNTCKGDDGSPLVCPLQNDPSRYVQAGIVAWRLGCGEDGIPAVYANVAHGRRWIDEKMAFYNLNNTVYQYSPAP